MIPECPIVRYVPRVLSAAKVESIEAGLADQDQFNRQIYGVLGIPLDVTGRMETLNAIRAAVQARTPFLLSTPNVNFLVQALRDREFRETLLESDHCCPDGMPLVWLARLVGVPVRERVSGSDLFESLRTEEPTSEPLKVFLFGGGEGIAERVSNRLNHFSAGIRCVGYLYPGFGSVETMSSSSIIEQINSSGADLLGVFLSARKAQLWLRQNHSRLTVPVRGQFGATINYQAGLFSRAPPLARRMGFEWLWRIKEEPYLWRRYWSDGKVLLWAFVFHAVPLLVAGLLRSLRAGEEGQLSFARRDEAQSIVIELVGIAVEAEATRAAGFFRSMVAEGKNVVLDLSRIRDVDARFFGLILILRKELHRSGRHLSIVGVGRRLKRLFRLNGFEYLVGYGQDDGERDVEQGRPG